MKCIRLLAAICLTWLSGPAVAAVCVHDDTNQTVCAQQAQRVLVLAPHLTEIVDFVGGMSKVIAVDGSSNFPESVNTLPKLGNPWMLSAESILARKPDLVLVWQSGISMQVVAQLRKAGVPVFVSEPKKIEQVATTMRRVSKLLGTEQGSASRIDDWLQQFEALRAEYRGRTQVPVFYQVWGQPLMTLGGQHAVSEVIGLCGGRNVFGDLPNLAAQVSVEGVLKRKPEVLLASGSGRDHQGFVVQWSAWPQMPAVKRNHVYTLPNDILVRNGPRLIQAAKLVCAHVEQARR
ncbi:cobalamin-binding protein [Limnobacter sp. MED105]|uniref:cobalamin-binding protein n=1 Tax=Limnobacter sp. MED105 TaxID=391597 RepID=UPI000156CB77|nr:cobalamin-binding protein [Limnobacter sp. MED105]EDM83848.1 probable substrate-binding periplasmic (pbp) abc transporter protein [Limnobacter sp. MED105]